MRLPDFFIVGAAKSGTTAMKQYLGKHPEVFMHYEEVFFFSKDLYSPSSPQVRTLEEYAALFARRHKAKRIGEKSVNYLVSRVAAEEIKKQCPEARIIVMLRNPADMLYSLHSQMLFEHVEEIDDFEQALKVEEARKRGAIFQSNTYWHPSVLYYSDYVAYAPQVKRYFDVFGRERVKVIVFDDFREATALVYRETLEFLGVDPEYQPPFDVLNSNKRRRSRRLKKFLRYDIEFLWDIWVKTVPPSLRQPIQGFVNNLNAEYVARSPLPPKLRERINARYASEVERLSELLDRDLTHWTA